MNEKTRYFSFLGSASHPLTEHHGRLLLSEDQLNMAQSTKWSVVTFVLGLFFRTLAILFIFLKLFVFGEPSLQPDSKIAAKYWAFKRRADLTLEKVRYITKYKKLFSRYILQHDNES